MTTTETPDALLKLAASLTEAQRRCSTCFHYREARGVTYCSSRSYFGRLAPVSANEWCGDWFNLKGQSND